MKILFICHRIPYPPNKGEKIRAYNILRYLSKHHEVHLAFLVDDAADLKHVDTLRPMVKSLHYDVINPKTKKLKSGLSLFGRKSLSVSYFYSKSLQEAIDALIERENIDHIFCYSSPTAEYVFKSKLIAHSSKRIAHKVLSPGSDNLSSDLRPLTSGTLRLLMDFVDMDSYKWKQYAETAGFPMKWVYAHEANALLDYEARIAAAFHHSLFVSESEKRLFQACVPAPNISAVSNGVDHAFFHPGHKTPLEKKGPVLVFTGMMDYFPNVEGVVWFAEEVFPELQRVSPDLIFYIVGNRPAPEVKRLGEKKGIVVTGFVEDVRDYVALADVCVIPLRIARGIQNKVLEAMSMGKAVVATSGAVDGIAAEDGRHLLVADTPSDFGGAVTRMLQDEACRRQFGQASRDLITNRYDWENILTGLEGLME